MGDGDLRGTGTSVRWGAVCKDCARRGDTGGFEYSADWLARVEDRGGTRSDRCPACRKEHQRASRSIAVPYVELDTIGYVADRDGPTGPLGGLGPLPPEHRRDAYEVDLATFEFGLSDDDVRAVLEGLEGSKRVAIVVAGTGSGKSTFLPYRLLYPPDGSRLRLSEGGPILVTEPRREATIGTATMVATLLCGADGPGPGSPVGYRISGDHKYDESCPLLFVTDGSIINWLVDGSIRRFSCVMVDEAHELNANIELTLAYLAANLDRFPQLRVIVASATIDPAPFVEIFGGEGNVTVHSFDSPSKAFGYGMPMWPCEPIDVMSPQWRHPHWDGASPDGTPLRQVTQDLAKLRLLDTPSLEIKEGKNFRGWQDEMPSAVAKQVLKIVEGTGEGDIIAFLHGEKAIRQAQVAIEDGLPSPCQGSSRVVVLPFTRETQEKEKAKVRAGSKAGLRRVILATNIAETSLTLDGLRYVVDSGLINQKQWDAGAASARITAVGHSQHGLRQRWGRVGRKAPGWVFPLYTRAQFERLEASTPPEATRSNLEGLVLTAKAAGVSDLADLPFISLAKSATFDRSFSGTFEAETGRADAALRARGAVAESGVITPKGNELLRSVGEVGSIRSALIAADRLACAVEVATAIALLIARPVAGGLLSYQVNWTAEDRRLAYLHHQSLGLGCVDDLELVLSVFDEWSQRDDRDAWAVAHFLEVAALQHAETLRCDLLDSLNARTRTAKQDVRPLRQELLGRARLALRFGVPDLVVHRTDGGWVDAQDRPVRLDLTAVHPPGASLLLALQRQRTLGEVWCASTVSLEGIPTVTDEPALLLAVTDLGGGTLAPPVRSALAAIRARWPVGSVVQATVTHVGQVNLDHVLRGPKPAPRPYGEESGDLDQQGTATATGDVDVDPVNEDPDGVSETASKPGPTDSGAVTGVHDGLQPAPDAPITAVWEDRSAPGSGEIPVQVMGYELSAGSPIVVVRDAAPCIERPAWSSVASVVTSRIDGWGGTIVEVRLEDGGRCVLGHQELSLGRRFREAGRHLLPGMELRLDAVPGAGLSLRPALGRWLQHHGTGRASVVSVSGDQVALALGNGRPANGVVLDFSAPSWWFRGTPTAGCRAFISLRHPAAPVTVTAPGLPRNTAELLDREGIAYDERTGHLTTSDTISASTRGRLLGASRDPGWRDAVNALWLASLPTDVNKPIRIAPATEDIKTRLAVGSVHTATVVKVASSGVGVRVVGGQGLPEVWVVRERVGTGALVPETVLSTGDSVTVEVLDVSDNERGVRAAGCLPGVAVPPLMEQFRAACGDSRAVEGRVARVADDYALVDLPANLTGHLRGPTSWDAGESVTVVVSGINLRPDKQRPQILRFGATLEPPRLRLGRERATVVAVEATRVVVSVGGARRPVRWQNIGSGGLVEPSSALHVGDEVDVDVQIGRHGLDLRIDIVTEPLDLQVVAHFAGRRLDGLVSHVVPGRAFVRIDSGRKLEGSLRSRDASGLAAGDRIAVTVKAARVTHGRLQIDLLRA